MQLQLLNLFNSHPSFTNFIGLRNEEIVNSLINYSHQYTHLAGPANSGKTHLLKSWVNQSDKEGSAKAIYFDLKDPEEKLFNLHELVEKYQFIAIDNIDYASPDTQILLFDLYNLIKLHNQDNFLLTSSTRPIEQLAIRADLATRILSGLNLYLKMLNDEEILEVLDKIAKDEGIGITDAEINYLINHYTRNIGALINIVRKAADVGVLEKRSITIPLIKKIIES